MSATDNILAGISGALEGFSNVYVPYIQQKNKFQQEAQLQHQKTLDEEIPIEQLEGLTGQKFPNVARGTRVSKTIVPFLTKQQEGTTTLVDSKGQKVGEYQGKIDLLKGGGKFPVTQSQARQLAAMGQPLPDGAVIIPDEKAQNPAQQKDLTDRLDELDSVLADVGSLRQRYNSAAKGIAGGIAGLAARTPLGIGGAIAPNTKTYEDTVGTTALNVQKVLTKTGRALGSGLKSEMVAFPSPGDNPGQGNQKFDEVVRKLTQRRNAMASRLGIDAKSDAGVDGSGSGNSGDQYKSAEEVRAAFQSGKIDRATAKSLLSQ